MKDSVIPDATIVSTVDIEQSKPLGQSEKLRSVIARPLSSESSEENRNRQTLMPDASNVSGKSPEDENLAAEPVEYQNLNNKNSEEIEAFPENSKKEHITAPTTPPNSSANTNPVGFHTAPSSPHRQSQESLFNKLSAKTPFSSESSLDTTSGKGPSEHERNLSNELPTESVEVSAGNEIFPEEGKTASQKAEINESVNILSPLSPSKRVHFPLSTYEKAGHPAAVCNESNEISQAQDTLRSQEISLNRKPSLDQGGPPATLPSGSLSASESEGLPESMSNKNSANQALHLPGLDTVSSFVNSSFSMNLPTNIKSFKEILAMKSPNDRIRNFDETREKYYAVELGLGNWIRQVKSQNPDLAKVTSHFSGYSSTTVAFQPSHHNKLPSNSSNLMPIASSFRHGTGYGSGPGFTTLYQTSPAENKPSTNQVQTRGKELFHTAGMIGGKAGKAGKGLFVKGKNRLRAAGGGDKEKDKSATTRTKPEKRASWGLPLMITRISGKRDSSLHGTRENDSTLTANVHSQTKASASSTPVGTSSTNTPAYSDESLATSDMSQIRPAPLLYHREQKTWNPNSKTEQAQDAKNYLANNQSHHKSPKKLRKSSGSGRTNGKVKHSSFSKTYKQFIPPLESGKPVSSGEKIIKSSTSRKNVLQKQQKLGNNNDNYPDLVSNFSQNTNTNQVAQSKYVSHNNHATHTGKALAFEQTIQPEQEEVDVDHQKDHNISANSNSKLTKPLKTYTNDNSLPHLPSLPHIPPLSLSTTSFFIKPTSHFEVQDSPLNNQMVINKVPIKSEPARRSMIVGSSFEKAEREIIGMLSYTRRNSDLNLDFGKKQDEDHQFSKKKEPKVHNKPKTRSKDSSSYANSKKRALGEIIHHQVLADEYRQPKKLTSKRPNKTTPIVHKPLKIDSSIVDSYSHKAQRGSVRESHASINRSPKLFETQPQINWVARRSEASTSVPHKERSKNLYTRTSSSSHERQNYSPNGSSPETLIAGMISSEQPPSSAQRYPELFTTEPTPIGLIDKNDMNTHLLKQQVPSSQAPYSAPQHLASEDIASDPVRPGSNGLASKSKPTTKILKEMSDTIHAHSRNKNRYSSDSYDTGLDMQKMTKLQKDEYENTSIVPNFLPNRKKNRRDPLSGGSNHTSVQNTDAGHPMRRNISARHHRNPQALGSVPFISENPRGLRRWSSPARHQYEVSNQVDPQIRRENQTSSQPTKKLFNSNGRIRRDTQSSDIILRSGVVTTITSGNPDKKSSGRLQRSSGSGLLNSFFSLLGEKSDQQTNYSHKYRSQGAQGLPRDRQKKTATNHPQAQAKEVTRTYLTQSEPESVSFTGHPDQTRLNTPKKELEISTEAEADFPSQSEKNLHSPTLKLPYQTSISPVSSLSSLRPSEIGTLITVSACSPSTMPHSSKVQTAQTDSNDIGHNSSTETIRLDPKLGREVHLFKASHRLINTLQENGSSETIHSPTKALPMQSFLLSDQETIRTNGEITNENDNDDMKSHDKRLNIEGAYKKPRTSLNDHTKLKSHETGVVMTATSYPGQEWNPYLAGA